MYRHCSISKRRDVQRLLFLRRCTSKGDENHVRAHTGSLCLFLYQALVNTAEAPDQMLSSAFVVTLSSSFVLYFRGQGQIPSSHQGCDIIVPLDNRHFFLGATGLSGSRIGLVSVSYTSGDSACNSTWANGEGFQVNPNRCNVLRCLKPCDGQTLLAGTTYIAREGALLQFPSFSWP